MRVTRADILMVATVATIGFVGVVEVRGAMAHQEFLQTTDSTPDVAVVSQLLVAAGGVQASIQNCDHNIWTQSDSDKMVKRAMTMMNGKLTRARADSIVMYVANSFTIKATQLGSFEIFCKMMTKTKIDMLIQDKPDD